MAMTPLHRFARRQLWRLVALLAALVVLARLLGAHTALQIVEWMPMTVAVVLLALHAGAFARRALARRRVP